MGLPFKPESIESLKARLPLAMKKVWRTSSLPDQQLMIDRPGLHREHIFDTFEGLRLIVSRDLGIDTGREYLHISGSIQDRSNWKDAPLAGNDLVPVFLQTFKEIAGLSDKAIGLAHVASTEVVTHLVFPMSIWSEDEKTTTNG